MRVGDKDGDIAVLLHPTALHRWCPQAATGVVAYNRHAEKLSQT